MQCFYTESPLEVITLQDLGLRIKEHIISTYQIDPNKIQLSPTSNHTFTTYPNCICESLALLSKSIFEKHYETDIHIGVSINDVKELVISIDLSVYVHELSNYAKYYKIDDLPTIKHINPLEIGLYIVNTLLQHKFNGSYQLIMNIQNLLFV